VAILAGKTPRQTKVSGTPPGRSIDASSIVDWRTAEQPFPERCRGGRSILPTGLSRCDTPCFDFAVQPKSLLGALCLQFAISIVGGKDYRQCVVCNTWFEMSLYDNGRWPDCRYCSNVCRNKALRQRQKNARKMRSEGKSLREISKSTGSKTETIKNWLNRKNN
jgi:hypothetical protein